ncbi:MAG: type III-B CRISPR module-associated protein Cmr3 [Flexibacter sp. CG_4_10_14_3_um_filter_32_15]|nr:MAG: type III-B CRISPR module-associated protein Cmr3 [Flexibacter sp. CG_4_10_14_3_um_filter_32_15]
MILQIEAIDTLFFRDGKPFEMGDENSANGIFPPLPSVFYGAIRSAYFSQYPEKLELANTDEDPTKVLKIRGLYLLKGIKAQFIIPSEMVEKDFLVEEGMEQTESRVLYSYNHSNEEVFSSNPLTLNPYQDEVKSAKGFIERSSLDSYLKDDFKETNDFFSLDNYITNENKVGIGRQNSTRTTEEGKLYRVKLNRPEIAIESKEELILEKTYFLLDINLEDLQENKNTKDGKFVFRPSFLKLGGENKIATCSIYSKEIKISEPVLNNKKFKIYLQTPAIFQNSDKESLGGWLPSCFTYNQQEKAYIGIWRNVKLKLLRAFINGSISIGGFDVKIKQPKKMYQAVPAGSIYHFEILDNTDSNTIYSQFGNLNNPISEILANEGFGLSYTGILNK